MKIFTGFCAMLLLLAMMSFAGAVEQWDPPCLVKDCLRHQPCQFVRSREYVQWLERRLKAEEIRHGAD